MYYPVSALVTLFANILQNPQDPRARSDLRLMNVVVEFLQTVQKEDESESAKQNHSSIQRMLTVCDEFHRISQLVLDKAEKESVTRRKRKNDELRQPPQQQQPRSANSNGSYSTIPPSTPPTASVSPPTSILNHEMNAQVCSLFPLCLAKTNKSSSMVNSQRLSPLRILCPG
jgi:hypothetical protein